MNYMETGHIIAEARKKKQLTQKQLADRINVSDRTVSKWECGKGFPDPSLLEPLSDALQISIADIVCGRITETQPRVCFKTGRMPDRGRFFRQTRRLDAGILTDFKSNQRSPGGKRCLKTAF